MMRMAGIKSVISISDVVSLLKLIVSHASYDSLWIKINIKTAAGEYIKSAPTAVESVILKP